MAGVIPLLLSFPPENIAKLVSKTYDTRITSYISELDRIPQSTWTKPVGKQNILDLLDPAVNSIPYLIALRHQVIAAAKDQALVDELVKRARSFFFRFDPIQIRYVGEHWQAVLMWLFDTFDRSGITDMRPLHRAILRLDPSGGTFTFAHLRLVRLCLDIGVPSQAVPVLDKNIYAYPQNPPKGNPEDLLCEDNELSSWFLTPKTGLTFKMQVEHVLEYYLLGAIVYIGQRNWSRARLFLEHALLTPSPAHVVSALQVEAYKKWVLVGLVETGRPYPLSKTIDQAAIKIIRAMAKPYDTLAQDFERRDWRKYHAEMDVGTQIWFEEGNLALVRETSEALSRYRVIDLQKTYAALPVSRVAASLDLPQSRVQQILETMIEQKSLRASIGPADATDPVLTFNSDPATTLSAEAQDEELKAQTKRIEDLVGFVRDADRRLQLTKEFVESQRRMKRSGAGPDGDLADQMDLSWDAPDLPLGDDDEDIMAR